MSELPIWRLSEAARVVASGSDCIYWMTESGQGVWSAPNAGRVVSLLQEPLSAAALLRQLPTGAERALEYLIRRGLVESASDAPYIAQFCRELGIIPQLVERNRWMKGATVRNLSSGIEVQALGNALAEASAPVREDGELLIVTVADYLDPRIEDIHRECLRSATPWVLVKLTGSEVWIGPFFVPGRTACWRCLEMRLRERAWVSSQIAPGRAPLWNVTAFAGRVQASAELAAREIVRWLLEAPPLLEGVILSHSWASARTERHLMARRVNCTDCRPMPLESPPRNFELSSAKGRWNPPGALRFAGTPDILERLEPHTDTIAGIVHRLERRDLSPAPLVFTYGAVHNVAFPPPELRMPGAIVHPGVCSGRGWSAEEAKAACLAEAVERYSLQFRGDEVRIRASCRDLGASAIPPNRVLLFSDRQLAARNDWNQRHGPDEAVPESFDEDEPVEWMKGWSLTAQDVRFLPMALASLYYRAPGTRWIGDADSNGCASGSTREEAVLHGILELVERDAVGIWWFNQAGRPRYDLRTVRDPLGRSLCGQLEEQGWQVWAEDLTTDLGIPVFLAIACRQGTWIHGAAAHLHAATALRMAMCELWQLSKTPGRTGQPPSGQSPALFPLEIPWEEEPRDVDLRDLIGECCAGISRAGHEVVVFEMTRPEIAFPVVRVVAPGLRHIKPRFAPGRLYEAPLRLGWVERLGKEEEFPVESA